MLSHITQESSLYSVLKNGVIVYEPEDSTQRKIIEIVCEDVDAITLLALAESDCPEAVASIEKAIASAQKSN